MPKIALPNQKAMHASTRTTARRYLAVLSLAVCLVIVSIFGGFHYRTDHLIREQFLRQARAFFQEIVLTRQWVSDHGGVYVPLREGMQANPYLAKIPGLKVVAGEPYTLKNPALVTREISELGLKERLFTFHITSLKPVNPANRPDSFEQDALAAFEAGNAEVFRFEETGNSTVMRYMAPLITQKSCLGCHASQGYKEGDVRGGISVAIPAKEIFDQLRLERTYQWFSMAGIIALIIALMFLIAHYFVKDLKKAEQQLRNMATTDFLTGLLNRREGLRRFKEEISKGLRSNQPLSVIILDVDYFKKINDDLGHLVGDWVLIDLANTLVALLRNYDIVCRYGGEEFLLILPATVLEQALDTADRLRQRVAKQAIALQDGRTVPVTISLGVAQLRAHESLDGFISRADTALYLAKENGRNQVRAAQEKSDGGGSPR